MSDSDERKTCDVIVVLGAAVWEGGVPSKAMKRRVLHAVELFNNGRSKALLFTGGLGKYPPEEAIVMSNIAQAEGIPQKSIVLEKSAKTTFESVIKCINIMNRYKWTSAIVVSDSYHTLRATFSFRFLGINALNSGTEGWRKGNPLWKVVFYHLREMAAILWYLILLSLYKYNLKNLD